MNSTDKPRRTTKTSQAKQTRSQSSLKSSQLTSPRVMASTQASKGNSSGNGSNIKTTKDNNRKSIQLNQRHGTKKAPTNILKSELVSREVDHYLDANEMASTSSLHEESCNLIEQETSLDKCSGEMKASRETRDAEADHDNDEDDDEENRTLLDTIFSTPSEEPSNVSKKVNKVSKPLPDGWEQHSDGSGPYFWHVPTGLIQRTRPTPGTLPKSDSVVLFHDDEEINHSVQAGRKISSDDDELTSCGAALTIADEPTLTDSGVTFIVYPVGCCEFDETQLITSGSTKAIQRCILKLSNKPTKEEAQCWGLDQSQPVLMRLIDNLIHFTDIRTQLLIRSQPIPDIKTWAVDDDNNFAFVVEDSPQQFETSINCRVTSGSVGDALLDAPTFMCYVFRSMDDDDMSCKVAATLNEQINRYRVQMSHKAIESTRLQQMIEQPKTTANNDYDQATDIDEDLEDLEESGETTMNVKYIGKVQVPKATGVDTLNAAIDKCLTDASLAQLNRLKESKAVDCTELDKDASNDLSGRSTFVPLVDSKIHVSPSSVIVENKQTGEIIVECRIRYLTFIGISRRDIRWCGFIMQNTTNKSFVAHCFECNPSAEHVCEAMRKSCVRMYEKVVKNQQRQTDATSIIPKGSLIRDTLAKTLSRIKLSSV